MKHNRISASIILTLGSLFVSSNLFAQQDMVQKRKEFMNANYDALKAIKRGIEQKDYGNIELKAKDIMSNMDHLLDYFPKGSISEKSKAKPDIWEKWDEFSKIPPKVKDVANALAKAAAAKDESAVEAHFQALGTQGSPYRPGACFDCHKTFVNLPPPAKKAGG